MNNMYPEMTAAELDDQLKAGKTLNLIDVREPDEWQAGHIQEARSIPLSELQERLDELQQGEQEIVLICRSGGRSGKACDFLHAQGYKVVNVTGGMLQWPGEVALGE
jgi:rhodanese-related sulfurtransferase